MSWTIKSSCCKNKSIRLEIKNFIRKKKFKLTKKNQSIKIKTDIRQFEKQGIEMEEQRKRILKELEQKHRNAAQQAEDYEEKIKANKKILDQTRIGSRQTTWLWTLKQYLILNPNRYWVVVQKDQLRSLPDRCVVAE